MYLPGMMRIGAVLCLAFAAASAHGQTIIHVDDDAPAGGDGTTWTTAFTHLQDALAAASPGDEIHVAAGTYKPDQDEAGLVTLGDRAATFQLISSVALYGGYAGLGAPNPDLRDIVLHETILSGDLNEDDGPQSLFEFGVCYTGRNIPLAIGCEALDSDLDNDVDSDDFVPFLAVLNYGENAYHVVTSRNTNRTAILDGFTITAGNANGPCCIDGDGGGMYNRDGSPTITNCNFYGNATTGVGGGLYSSGAGSSPLLSNCSFNANAAELAGGGISNLGLNSRLTNCHFYGNTAKDGGGVYSFDINQVMAGCKFSGNSAAEGGGVYSVSGTPTLVNCTFSANRAEAGSAMFNYQGLPTVTNCIVWGNTDATGSCDETNQIGGDAVTVASSCIQGWTGAFGGTGNFGLDPSFVDPDGPDDVVGNGDDDLHLQNDSPCIDVGNSIALPAGFPVDIDGQGRVLHCYVDLGVDESLGFSDCNSNGVSDGCDYSDGTSEDCNDNRRLDECDIALGNSGDLNGNGVPEECEVPVLYVDVDAPSGGDGLTWATAYHNVRHALHVAAAVTAVTEIRVAAGTYVPLAGSTCDRKSSFVLTNGVAMYGGYAGFGEPNPNQRDVVLHETVLSGDLNGDDGLGSTNRNDNSYHVVIGSGTDPTSVLDGFTITGGNANGADFFDMRGGGLYCAGGSPTLSNCTFRENRSNWEGGGMYLDGGTLTLTSCTFALNIAESNGGGGLYNHAGAPKLTNCMFYQNTAGGFGGGGMASKDGAPTLTDCTFRLNISRFSGGGIYDDGSDSVVTNCIFDENSARSGGGGMYNTDGNAAVTSCSFMRNSADQGGGMLSLHEPGPTVTNCIFSANTASSAGGGLATFGSSIRVSNCTFSENTSSDGGGMFVRNTSHPSISNSIFWRNSDSGGMDESGQIHIHSGTPVVNYSDVQGGWTGAGGIGNINADPLFADPEGTDNIPGTDDDNLRLLPGSPSIDSARNGDVPVGVTTDLSGDLRFIDSPDAQDCPQPEADCGIAPIVDMGAYEFGADDCNFNGIPNECELDCGPPGGSCDVNGCGLSQDCTGNGIPDECEPDCNGNGNADSCDIAVGNSQDCTGNGIPDECEPDCNGTEVADSCDIKVGRSLDLGCGGNGIPDECEPDCNRNFVPDSCDLVEGTSQDCDDNGIPDECEPDCNGNEVADSCDIADGTSLDIDCGGNGIPDECGPDCNGNGTTDSCDIAQGMSQDCNGNGIPDECASESDCNNNSIPDECESLVGRIIFVDDDALTGGDGISWQTALDNLQDALVTGSCGDEIRVAEGSYTPDNDNSGNVTPGDRAATFQLKSGVALYGGYAGVNAPEPDERNIVLHKTILTGDLNGDDGITTNCDDNSYHVVTGSTVDSTAILDGFTVTAGNANSATPNDMGGGMYNSVGSPTVRNCTFVGNKANELGGGMYNSNGTPTVSACTFSSNSTHAGGGMYNEDSNPKVTRCIFEGNIAVEPEFLASASGGGMQNVNSNPVVSECMFLGNTASGFRASGGGMDNQNSDPSLSECEFIRNSASGTGGGMYNGGMSPTVTNCSFSENTAGEEGGGMFNRGSNATVTNCTFSGNSGPSGGGMYNESSFSVVVTNCTFVGNSDSFSAGGIVNENSNTRVTNCILWGNRTFLVAPNQIFDLNGRTVVNYSVVEFGWSGAGGIGNIGELPLFVHASGGADGWGDDFLTPGTDESTNDYYDDLSLSSGSPCIDAGNNAAVPSDVTLDLLGKRRFFDDPGTEDTGVGTPNLPDFVDMGAYEFASPTPSLGDLDQDGDVDLRDFARWMGCFGVIDPLGCNPGATPDLDYSGEVNLDDYVLFIANWIGPN